MWTSNDSRFVGLHTNWDDSRMHGELGPPMYILWTKGNNNVRKLMYFILYLWERDFSHHTSFALSNQKSLDVWVAVCLWCIIQCLYRSEINIYYSICIVLYCSALHFALFCTLYVSSVYVIHYVQCFVEGGPSATPLGTLQPEKQNINKRFVYVLIFIFEQSLKTVMGNCNFMN